MLTVDVGTWSPATVMFVYQWYANGVAISGARSATYVPKAGDAGKELSVVVKGEKPGYVSVKKTTPKTAVVLP